MPGENQELYDEENKNSCVIKLRTLLSDDEHLNQLQSDDTYLLRFLRCADFDVAKAFKKIKSFYNLLEEYPEWFTLRVCPLDKKEFIERDFRILTPEYDKEGRRIYIIKIKNMNASQMDLITDVVAVDDFFMELLLQTDISVTNNGLCIIIDISNLSLNLMRWLSPQNIKIIFKRIHAMPIKNYIYHVVNNSFLVHGAIRIIWPFLPNHVKESIIFHFEDWNSLHEYIDKEVLPIEYQGTKILDNVKNSHNKIFDKYEQIKRSFKIDRELYLKNIQQ